MGVHGWPQSLENEKVARPVALEAEKPMELFLVTNMQN